MPVLQEMLPRDLLDYCQEHGLLDSVLRDEEAGPPSFDADAFGSGSAAASATPSYSRGSGYPSSARIAPAEEYL